MSASNDQLRELIEACHRKDTEIERLQAELAEWKINCQSKYTCVADVNCEHWFDRYGRCKRCGSDGIPEVSGP